MDNKTMEKGGLSTLGELMSKEFESGFDRFWKAWPKNPRKGGKSECQKKWAKFGCEAQVDQILKHIEWMKTTDQWRKNDGAFVPAPLVYINQQRWDGAEIPDVKVEINTELIRLTVESKKAVPMPDHVRQKLAQIRGKK
jgi:hypothetical protein